MNPVNRDRTFRSSPFVDTGNVYKGFFIPKGRIPFFCPFCPSIRLSFGLKGSTVVANAWYVNCLSN